MEDETEERLSRAFAALSDPVRGDIVSRLTVGDATVNDLAAPYDISLQAVSKHLKVLEEAGLVSRRREAQRRPVHLESGALATMTGWIERHQRRAEERMSRLEEVLADLPSSDHGSTSNRSRPMSTTPSTTDHITTATIEADPEVPVVRITRDFTATAEQLHRGHTSGMEIGINEGYAALDAGEVA